MDAARRLLDAARPGERWVVRHRLADGSATDAVGWIEEVTDTTVRLRAADGVRMPVSRSTVVMARRAPAAAGGPDPRRTAAEALERIAATGSAGESEPLGEWLLRAPQGLPGRVIGCLAVGDPGIPIERAAQAVIAWCERHAIPPRAHVVVASEVEARMASLGWQPAGPTRDVLVVRLADLLGKSVPDPRVSIEDSPGPDWLAGYRAGWPDVSDLESVPRADQGGPPHAFATGYESDGAVRAVARGHLTQLWLGLTTLRSAPDTKEGDLAGATLRGLGHWAARRGARYAYLQVAEPNPADIAAYARFGFVSHHRSRVLAPAATTAASRPGYVQMTRSVGA